jgi:hypothetical protein
MSTMKEAKSVNSGPKAPYQKPKWEKEPLLERFTVACTTGQAKTAACSHVAQRFS